MVVDNFRWVLHSAFRAYVWTRLDVCPTEMEQKILFISTSLVLEPFNKIRQSTTKDVHAVNDQIFDIWSKQRLLWQLQLHNTCQTANWIWI